MVFEFETMSVRNLPKRLFRNNHGLTAALRKLPLDQALFVPKPEHINWQNFQSQVFSQGKREQMYHINCSPHTKLDREKGGVWIWYEANETHITQ